MTKVAALYVDPRGVYANRPDVDCWDEARDARKYAGPWPVVAHPPCERWGRYWQGGPSARTRRELGEDHGCFAAALSAVCKWGGVLEHPADSHAWDTFSLMKPPRSGGWVMDNHGLIIGWTCRVDQGHYGHRGCKATWLYAVGVNPPTLAWGKARGCLGGDGIEDISKRQRRATPPAFAELLLSIARSATTPTTEAQP